jgi:hypothetical protein
MRSQKKKDIPEVRKLWLTPLVCIMDIFVLNEIWVQNKIYISLGILLG